MDITSNQGNIKDECVDKQNCAKGQPGINIETVLTEKPKSTKTSKLADVVLFVVDQFIAGIIIGPCTVLFWWGCWTILDHHFFKNRPDLSVILCMVIGNVGLLIVVFTQKVWKKLLPIDSMVSWIFGFHLYTFLCAFFNVCHWRGIWRLLDHYTGTDLLSIGITYGVGQGLLWFLKSSKSAQAPPMVIVLDRNSEIYDYTLRFRTQVQPSLEFVYDALFTVVIVHQLVVLYWRGVWGLFDLLLFPENKHLSMWSGFGIGYFLIILLGFLQPGLNTAYVRCSNQNLANLEHSCTSTGKPPVCLLGQQKNTQPVWEPGLRVEPNNGIMKKVSETQFLNQPNDLLRWILEVFLYFIANIINVVVWRSVWIFCDIYNLPDSPSIGNIIGMAVGFGILAIMNCSLSLTSKGCEMEGDGAIDQKYVCFAPNFYLRKIVKKSINNKKDVVVCEPANQSVNNDMI